MSKQSTLTFKGKKHLFKEMAELNNDNTVIWTNNDDGIEKTFGMDLGPVNEDGCLAEERTGLFPEVARKFDLEFFDWVWQAYVHVIENDIKITVSVVATTREGVIDAWNRRV